MLDCFIDQGDDLALRFARGRPHERPGSHARRAKFKRGAIRRVATDFDLQDIDLYRLDIVVQDGRVVRRRSGPPVRRLNASAHAGARFQLQLAGGL